MGDFEKDLLKEEGMLAICWSLNEKTRTLVELLGMAMSRITYRFSETSEAVPGFPGGRPCSWEKVDRHLVCKPVDDPEELKRLNYKLAKLREEATQKKTARAAKRAATIAAKNAAAGKEV
jgi:hypothetical protein